MPLVIAVMVWWERGRISREDVISLIPLLGLTLIVFFSGVTVFRHSAEIADQKLGWLSRVRLVGPAIWFYLNELIRPGTFSFVYPRWNPSAWWNWAFLAGLIIALAGLQSARRRLGRGPFAGALLFVILLLPHILFVDLRQSRDSFVADSAVYLAMAAIFVPVVAAISEALVPRGREVTARSAALWLAALCLLLAIALSLHVSNLYVSAESLWSNAIARFPNSGYALNQLGILELNTQQNAAAREHFLRALQLDPNDSKTHRNLGSYYETVGEHDHAYSEYFAAINIDPTDVDARCGLARALAAQRNYPEALAEFQKALQYRPNYELALNDMARLYTELGKYDQAFECYDKAIQAAPKYMGSYINLAGLYFQLSLFDNAFNVLGAAQQIDPRNYIIYLNAGTFYAKRADLTNDPVKKKEDIQHSEVSFRSAIFLNPDSGLAAFNLGKVLEYEASQNPADSGKMKEAVFYFNKACQLEPENPEYKRHFLAAKSQPQ
jgi:tetratricopeptide (TPR) repeat protein